MMNKPNCTLILFVLLSMVLGCKKDEGPTGPPATPSSVIMPLKVGNQWTFSATFYDSNGVALNGSGLTTISIIRDTTITGEKWYLLGVFGIASGSLLANRSDGLWEIDPGSSSPYLIFKFPASAGDTYSTSSLGGKIVVGSISSSITVPQGAYSCYEYKLYLQPSNQLNSVVYFAPNAGIIKQDSYNTLLSGRSYVSGR